MNKRTDNDDWNDIDIATYDWSVKVFRSLKKMLRVNMKLHADNQVKEGDIFLFNHFSRFETFIPQYLIYEQTGAYCCAIGSSEFFKEDNVLAKYLKNVGVYPHNHEQLFPILAAQIFRGRKVIIFPEGGMVKDRQVLDKHGHYSIFSRLTGERRKHHTGPAVLAQGIEAFKATVRNAFSRKDIAQLEQWKQDLRLESIEQLLIAALKPTLIVPSNITFYPIRASDNMLSKGVELFADGLSLRQTEELLIEGNIMLKDTDMDVRMGTPVDPYNVWHWWNRFVLEINAAHFATLEEVFALHTSPKNWKQKLLGNYFKKNAGLTRNEYMEEIYNNLTVNLSHLAASLIMYCISKKQQQIAIHRFYTTLYIAIKHLQKIPEVNLHRSLLNPDDYDDLISGKGKRFEHFIEVAESSELIKCHKDNYLFLPKLCEEHDFDSIRMENLVAIYNNEAAPIKAIRATLIKALKEYDDNDQQQLAKWHFDDEHFSLHWEKQYYNLPKFDDVNRKETADADPAPFFLIPKNPNKIGVLLIHGLLASPAEVKSYGKYLYKQGYTVLAVRIKGHGTSPYDLRELSSENWYEAVEKGYKILNKFCDRLFVTGFSTGGALAIKLAAEQHQQIIGVIALTVPVKFIDSTIMLVPLLHGTNKLVRWISTFEGVKPFIENDPEHPNVNYRNTPIRSLYELRRLIQEMEALLPQIDIPILCIFADNDPIVSLDSAEIMRKKLGTHAKQIETIAAKNHGILMDNTGDTWGIIDEFLNKVRADAAQKQNFRQNAN